MAGFSPLRTGQLVVRLYQPSWRRRAVLVALALAGLLLLYMMYEWGRFEGGYSKFAEIQHRRQLQAQIEELERENDKLRAQAAAAELAGEVERKAYADVEKNLADLQAQVLKHREELTFYRGIVSPEDGIGGLRVQRFRVLAGSAPRRFRLQLVLLQSMRQDAAVSGSASIVIDGVRDKRPAQVALGQLLDKPRPDASISFQFRYFQELQQEIVLPEGFQPRTVTVEVRSSRLTPVKESYPWQVAAES